MAHHGGTGSPPRVHRPRALTMSAQPPLTAPLAPLRPPPPVTLVAPRPENERAANEYVETPFRQTTTTAPSPPHLHHHLHQPPPPPHPIIPRTPPPPPRHQQRLPVVTKQPTTFCKDPTSASAECAARPSIMCPECGRCRCSSCRQPRPLPQKWVCNDTYLLSADSVVDYASCLCCVKGLFYHCSDSDGGVGDTCADDPCGCGPERRTARWTCLAALSFVLPCLWLYWPLRGCKRAVEACYARHSRSGCRCRPPNATTPEKRLLDSSGSEC